MVLLIRELDDFWEDNLRSFYRELPIKRLLVGNRGLLDEQIATLQAFPRVEILDVTGYRTSGYALGQLIEQVTTTWFVALDSAVQLSPGWFEGMLRHTADYAWIASHSQMLVLARYPAPEDAPRLSAQMARRAAFDPILPRIEDDYIDQVEDEVFRGMLEHAGYICQRVTDVAHRHQLLYPRGPDDQRRIAVHLTAPNEYASLRLQYAQVMSAIKYLPPAPDYVERVRASTQTLLEHEMLDWEELRSLVLQTNPLWWKYVRSVEPHVRAARRAAQPPGWRAKLARRVRPGALAGGCVAFLLGLAVGSVVARRGQQPLHQRLQQFVQASYNLIWG